MGNMWDWPKMREKKDVKGALNALKDEDWGNQEEAIKILGEIGDPKAVDPLIPFLSHERHDVRDKAERALIRIGKPAVKSLIQALKNENWSIRYYSASILRTLGDARAVEAFIQALTDDHEGTVEESALALGEIGDPRAVDPLIQALKSESPQVQKAAARAIEKIGDARAVEPLIELLRTRDSFVKSSAANALGRIGDARAVEPLIDLMKNDSQSLVRRAGAEALDNMGFQPRDDTERAYLLIAKERWDEVAGLGAAAVEPLIHAFKYAGAPTGPVTALTRIGAPAVEPLIHHLKNNRSSAAAKALGDIRDPRVMDALAEALKDSITWWEASVALNKQGFQPRDDTERAYLLVANAKWDEVAQLGEPAIEPLIREVKRLGHPEPAKALAKIGEPAVEPLIQLLEHHTGFVRFKAVTALGDIGDERAVEPLTNVSLNDADDSIRSAANEALKKLETGKM